MPSGADSTAVRTAMWRALHVLIDKPPHVLDDTLGLQIAGVDDDDWRKRPDMDPERTSSSRSSIVARARATEDMVTNSGAQQYVVLGAGLDTFAQRNKGTWTSSDCWIRSDCAWYQSTSRPESRGSTR
jgi:O-methyltransferase involved in polyketide biosynthesis